jgi:hypothetical protein
MRITRVQNQIAVRSIGSNHCACYTLTTSCHRLSRNGTCFISTLKTAENAEYQHLGCHLIAQE